MDAPVRPMYLVFVKIDLVCKEFERQFHEHGVDHVQEWARRKGCSHGWRTRENRDGPNDGRLEQEFWNIYHIDNPHMFKPGLALPPPTEKNPWLRDSSNWERVFYRVLASAAKDQRPARCWARFEMTFNGTLDEEAAFKQDYAGHLTKMTEHAGVHRAWHLEHLPHELAIGRPAAAKYMSLYEINAPENIFDTDLGLELFRFESRWSATHLLPEARHFAHVILDVPGDAGPGLR